MVKKARRIALFRLQARDLAHALPELKDPSVAMTFQGRQRIGVTVALQADRVADVVRLVEEIQSIMLHDARPREGAVRPTRWAIKSYAPQSWDEPRLAL